MAEITQGQRDVPYSGLGLGAYAAARGTPVGTGLQPEAEAMLRLQYIKQMVEVKKAEDEIKRQGLTSYSNMVVARLNADADVLNAFSNMARTQQMSNQSQMEFLVALEGYRDGRTVLSGSDINEKTTTQINKAALALNQMMTPASGSGSATEFVDANFGNDPRQFGAALRNWIVEKNASYLSMVAPTLRTEFSDPNVGATRRVDTKQAVLRNMLSSTQLGYDQVLMSLPNDEWGTQVRAYLQSDAASAAIQGQAIQGAYGIEGGKFNDLEATDKEKNEATLLRKTKKEEVDILRRQVESMSIGFPPAVLDSLDAMYEQTDDIVRLGVDGYIEKLGEVNAPIELNLAKQGIQKYLKELDNPTDPLSAEYNKIISIVPYFDNYMAAMGFRRPKDAVDYLGANPEEFREWYRTAKIVSETQDFRQLEDPMAIRERLRVAGSSNANSMFRRTSLTKPIERLLGVGINRRPAWRYFSGTNTTEQLDAAINALSRDPKAFDNIDLEETTEFADEGTVEELEARRSAERFAAGLPEKERKRVLRAAERFRSRIAPEEEEGRYEDKFLLPGILPSTQRKLSRERQVLGEAPQEEAAPAATRRRRGGFGAGRGPMSREEAKAQLEAEEAAERKAEIEAKRKEQREAKAAAKAAAEAAEKARKQELFVKGMDEYDPAGTPSLPDDEDYMQGWDNKAKQRQASLDQTEANVESTEIDLEEYYEELPTSKQETNQEKAERLAKERREDRAKAVAAGEQFFADGAEAKSETPTMDWEKGFVPSKIEQQKQQFGKGLAEKAGGTSPPPPSIDATFPTKPDVAPQAGHKWVQGKDGMWKQQRN